MANSNRQDLINLIKPLLPKKWVWFPYATNLDTISNTSVVLQFTGIKPYSIGYWQATYNLIIVEPKTTPGEADDSLDDSLIAVLMALDDIQSLDWSTGDRGVTDNGDKTGNPCFTIQLTFIIKK